MAFHDRQPIGWWAQQQPLGCNPIGALCHTHSNEVGPRKPFVFGLSEKIHVCVCGVRRMQDLAQEIASLMEPSKPLGYRLVLFKRYNHEAVLEAKAVKFKGGIGFLVRCDLKAKFGSTPPPVEQLPALFAPTEEALKFVFRKAYNSCSVGTQGAVLIPPGNTGYGGGGCLHRNMHFKCEPLDATDPDSPQERILRELVAALTLLQVPEGLQW